MVARVHEIAGRLHGLRAANGLQDGRHRVSMGKDVFARVQRLTHQKGLCKGPRTRQRIDLGRQTLRGRGE